MPHEADKGPLARLARSRTGFRAWRKSMFGRVPKVKAPKFVTATIAFLAQAAELSWRVPLIVGAAAMLFGGVLHSNGEQRASALSVTAGIAIAMIGVPLGLLGLKADRGSDADLQQDGAVAPEESRTQPAQLAPASHYPPPPPARRFHSNPPPQPGAPQ